VKEPFWLSVAIINAIHDEQLARHGGAAGIRDLGMLESALERPRNKWHYGETDLAGLGAAYAFGLARNHPYIDGNKRSSLLALFTFLGINGLDFIVPEPEAAVAILALAAGELDEDALTRWVKDHLP